MIKTSAPQFVCKKTIRIVFLLLSFILLSMPLLIHVSQIESTTQTSENRALAPYPGKPNTRAEWSQWSAKFDRYLGDHFGLRQHLVKWNQAGRYHLLHEVVSPQITVGKEGYLFFNAHEAQHPLRMLSFICGRGIDTHQTDELAQQVVEFAQFVSVSNPRTTIAFVPSKPAVYPEYLPSWWQRECERHQATLDRVSERVRQTLPQADVVYPLAQMLQAKTRRPIYPAHDFHWQGKGAQVYARILSEQHWHRAARGQLSFQEELSESDMQRFLPGVDLRQRLQKPDWKRSDFTYCEGGPCFPELSSAAILADVTRITRRDVSQDATQTKQRLLLLTDSFGHGVAPYFAPYFDEVWHVSSNNMGALNPQQLAQLKTSFEQYAPTQTLYLFHDFALACFSQTLKYCPLELPPVLRAVHPQSQ
ncbi:hypothetical protein RF679_03695 [Undibacterium cyanobacteriorum]|uniref:AlgX/AlgJ SGNH hydrolase-like domain-containing protein n=1 Tax=Undibacterium cyanobacteriorum TaxID=3073561 RepID=A0ABY9RL30_9BURK|nr:hypothetical protein [Undibacterium sp. 20NA77.5]WMW81390.1 hypothetical protein RF679_03695 [Undibacterium sp. 20NA77.5]